jgi:hypothetical protein
MTTRTLDVASILNTPITEELLSPVGDQRYVQITEYPSGYIIKKTKPTQTEI